MTTEETDIKREHPKFISPITDFGFKVIFKDEEITRGFLNALIKTQYPMINIASVTITDGEVDETVMNVRRVVFDVRCITDTGEEFVIEMQNTPQEFFSERIVHYLSRAASRQQAKGYIEYRVNPKKSKKKKLKKLKHPKKKTEKRDWNYHMKNIYGVFFMNFKDSRHPKKLAHVALWDHEDNYIDTEVFQYWKIQMPFYREMKESDCEKDIDKWIYNLTNMPEMKTQLAFTNEIPLFMRLEEVASYSQLTPQQQIQYDDSFNNYLAVLGNEAYNKRVGYEHGMKDGMEKGMKQGIEKGMKQGMEKGEKSKALKIAYKMKAHGDSIEYIIDMTGLSIDEINEL